MKKRLAAVRTAARRDARVLAETFLGIVTVWLLIGWSFDEPLLRGDGPRLFAPYLRSALEAGTDWTANTYRFATFGGSAMHPAMGTSPLTLVWSAIGISTTTAGNLNVLFDQLCVAFFAIVLIEALLTMQSGSQRLLSASERALTASCCAFAPLLGWRLGVGHENLLEGMLPWLAAIASWWSARAGMLSVPTLLVVWLAVVHALPGLGQQTLVYSAVFGAPLTLITLLAGPKGTRFARGNAVVLLVLVAGIFCAYPLLLDVAHYQLGDDASRGARSMFYAYGDAYGHDWLTSLPWTTEATYEWPGKIPAHETNYPIGPLALFVVALRPSRFVRELGFAMIAGALLALAFSLDLEPLASLLRRLPLLDAFRVPARAILPIVLLLPVLAFAALWSRTSITLVGHARYGTIAGAVVAIAMAPMLPSIVREVLAWISCVGLCILLRRHARGGSLVVVTPIVVVSALGVAAFVERYDMSPVAHRVEDEPETLREHVLALAPDLASPLTRVQVPDRPAPFEKSFAFAAGLSTLDGVGFPPRRFLRLLAALWNEPVSVAEADFELTHRDRFDILAQLYNVRYVVQTDGSLTRLPSTNGPAWFTYQVAWMADPREMIRVLRMRHVDVRAMLANVAWILRDEAPIGLHADPACANARVTNVTTDELGQSATIEVMTAATCVLVVATNYASVLDASSAGHALSVFPVNIALVGIVVPAGATRVELGPRVQRAWWWSVLGVVALAAAIGIFVSSRHGASASSSG